MRLQPAQQACFCKNKLKSSKSLTRRKIYKTWFHLYENKDVWNEMVVREPKGGTKMILLVEPKTKDFNPY